jgi:hypothetical protein
MKALRPFFLIAAFILMVGLACSVVLGNETPAPNAQPTDQQQVAPTEPPAQQEQPTAEPPTAESTAEQPTAEPTQAPQADKYFTDNFDADSGNYSYFEFHEAFESAEPDKSILPAIKDGYMVFNLQKPNKWVFALYDGSTYDNVKTEVSVDNRGKNNNNIMLLCRYSDEGWYAFSIANNGLYWIWAYDRTGAVSKGWNLIVNGGSTAIKQGKDTNTYTASCSGDSLSLFINGKEVKTISDRKFKFREGKVGFGVLSFEVMPILVDVNSLKVSQP